MLSINFYIPAKKFCGLILILLSLYLINCASILYGYDKVTEVDEVWSRNLAAKAHVDPQNVTFLDSSESVQLRTLGCSSNQSIQPLQLHYVTGDTFVSSYFNCYAPGGLRNLNWKFEDMNYRLVSGDCVTSNIDINKQLRILANNNSDNFILVVFSSMFRKQSEQLITLAAMRSSQTPLLLVNIDAYYSSVLND